MSQGGRDSEHRRARQIPLTDLDEFQGGAGLPEPPARLRVASAIQALAAPGDLTVCRSGAMACRDLDVDPFPMTWDQYTCFRLCQGRGPPCADAAFLILSNLNFTWARMRSALGGSLVAIAALGAASLLCPPKAHAWLKICNYSTEPRVYVTLAYYSSNSWLSRGWWTVENGNCATVVGGGRLANRYYYFRAEGQNGVVWGQGSSFCTLPSRFTLYNASQRCTNGTFKQFSRIDTGDYDNFTYKLWD